MVREKNEDVDLRQLFRTLWRGKFWILLSGLIALLIGGWYVFVLAKPLYTSSAVVVLESRQEQVVDIKSVMTGLSGDQATINTEVEVIRSRELIKKLVQQLSLDQDPEFNPYLRESSLYSLGGITEWLIEKVGPAIPSAKPNAQNILDEVIDNVLRAVTVVNIRNSYVFEIIVITEDPKKSALMANTIADLYINDQLEVKFAATEKATNWLTDRVAQLKVELESAEAAAKHFNASTDLVSPEALAGLNRQIKDLRDRLSETRRARLDAQAQLNSLVETAQGNDPAEMARVANDRTLTQLLERFGGDRKSFDDRYKQIVERARLEVRRIDAQIEALESTIEQQERQIARQSADLVRLQQLEREAEASGLIYEYFLGRLKETSVQQGIQQADARVLSRAVIPLEPSAPQKPLLLALAITVGLMAGSGFVILRELSKNTFRLPEDLEERTGYSVIGQIPIIPARRRKNVLKYISEKPASAAAEAIRNLRTSLLLSDIDCPPQVIMSTSSVPGEGKTTQSLALAHNLSGLGKKVLLIEADIRRRTFAEYFDLQDQPGLISVLSGESSLEEAAFAQPDLKSDLIVGEKATSNAADVFASERFRKFLKDVRERYDHIIVDTPPVLAVPDARVIGQAVDAIVYTVRWDSTTHRQVLQGIRFLEDVNLKITGLALSQISAKGMKGYGYGDSAATYSSYYE
jgi:capsular exopolysaccharide synthesis family protein